MTPRTKTTLVLAYWLLTALTLAGCVALTLSSTLHEETSRSFNKIFYAHMPAGVLTLLAGLVAFLGGVGYLWQRRPIYDCLSAAGASVAALTCTFVLGTGMYWGHSSWGAWWDWTPRLTLTLILWLLYVVYVLVRASVESRQRRAVISAVYAIAAFVDVPLVYFSTKLMPDIHPAHMDFEPGMRLRLGLWFIPMTLLVAGLIGAMFARNRRRLEADLARADRDASDGDDAPK